MITPTVDQSVADLDRVRRLWDEADELSRWPRPTTPSADLLATASETPGPDAGAAGVRETRLAIVLKAPHALEAGAVDAIAARVLAFGGSIHELVELAGRTGDDIARALYPSSWAGHTDAGLTPRAREAVAARFDQPTFADVHGRAFDPAMIFSAERARTESGLSVEELSRIWDEGRRPIARDVLVERHGPAAAARILGGRDAFDWFHNVLWPIGIQRITSGLMAFGLRHEAFGPDPVIIVNGHFHGLAQLFEVPGGVATLDVAIPAHMPVAVFREHVIGAANNPAACLPGSIRGDAGRGLLPWTTQAATPQANVLHCSDGPVAGMFELGALLDRDSTARLDLGPEGRGFDEDELRWLALDPWVDVDGRTASLTTWTSGMTLSEATAFIERVAPPLFGSANGHGDGLGPQQWHSALNHLLETRGDPAGLVPAETWTEIDEPAHVAAEQGNASDLFTRGAAAIGRGEVGLLALAGGTGGRLGGYHLPESHPDRQKALRPLLEVHGSRRSCLDIRLANARWWEQQTGGAVRLAVLASPTNVTATASWTRERAGRLSRPPLVYRQAAIPRFSRTALLAGWGDYDAIARTPDGRPLTKPAGSFGAFTAFVLAGHLQTWLDAGVKYVVLANGDDAGARIQPGAIGLLDALEHQQDQDDPPPPADAVVLAVPRGFRATANGRAVQGDESGWRMTADGSPVDADADLHDVVVDQGGAVVMIGEPPGRLVVAERPPPDSAFRWFNTNQLVLRLDALARVLGLGESDPVTALRRARANVPMYAEVKPRQDGQEVVQVFQTAADVLRLLRGVHALRLPRPGEGEGVGTFTPLKRPEDVPFAQRALDLIGDRDHLDFG